MGVRRGETAITAARDNQVAPLVAGRYLTPMADPKSAAAMERERRLQAALRENLKRRKAQARGRAENDDSAEPHDSAGITGEKDTG
jgi:hypothetical protein